MKWMAQSCTYLRFAANKNQSIFGHQYVLIFIFHEDLLRVGDFKMQQLLVTRHKLFFQLDILIQQ